MGKKPFILDKKKEIWHVVWLIWLSRNNIIFNNGVFDLMSLLDLVKIQSWSWFSTHKQGSLLVFFDWCLHPLMCISLNSQIKPVSNVRSVSRLINYIK